MIFKFKKIFFQAIIWYWHRREVLAYSFLQILVLSSGCLILALKGSSFLFILSNTGSFCQIFCWDNQNNHVHKYIGVMFIVPVLWASLMTKAEILLIALYRWNKTGVHQLIPFFVAPVEGQNIIWIFSNLRVSTF